MRAEPADRGVRGVAAWLLSSGAPSAGAMSVLAARALRALVDGYVAVLLPAYLLALGFGSWEVGLLSTATLLGSALATLAVGAWGHRFGRSQLLRAAAMLMAATGLTFALQASLWPLLVVAFVGTLNPSSGDVSVFLPLEHARLAETPGEERVALFARYSLLGALFAAFGALASAIPDWASAHLGVTRLFALRGMFLLYGAAGLAVWAIYRRLSDGGEESLQQPAPLDHSRRVVLKLAALFGLDSFAGGLVLNAILALWLFRRFDLSLAAAGAFFFCAGLLAAGSQLAAPLLARRIGLLNTMVFTHIPSSICLILAALAPNLPAALTLLFLRSALSQMDVPARGAFVMAVVTPSERAAAASFTAVPRSLASAISPTIGGALLAAGWLSAPLIACGVLKIAYDLALFAGFRRVVPQT
jgi:MFS family permease